MHKINGLIFAGGKSIRMGHDKALIDYHGKPQNEFLFELMTPLCDQVFTSCKAVNDVAAYLNPLPDQLTLDSPLNGVISAFRQHDSVAWLTVPVDMPFIDEATLQFLIAHRNETKVATCFYDSDGKDPEPLLTLWEPHAKPLLEKYVASGNKGIKYFLLQHNIQLLHAPDKKIHVNINSEEQRKEFFKNKL